MIICGKNGWLFLMNKDWLKVHCVHMKQKWHKVQCHFFLHRWPEDKLFFMLKSCDNIKKKYAPDCCQIKGNVRFVVNDQIQELRIFLFWNFPQKLSRSHKITLTPALQLKF